MTNKEIKKRLKYIRDMSGDYEVAHAAEDALYQDFVQYIAENSGDYSKLACLILTSCDIVFPRHCA